MAQRQRPAPAGIRAGCARHGLERSAHSADGLGIQLPAHCGPGQRNCTPIVFDHLVQRHRRGHATRWSRHRSAARRGARIKRQRRGHLEPSSQRSRSHRPYRSQCAAAQRRTQLQFPSQTAADCNFTLPHGDFCGQHRAADGLDRVGPACEATCFEEIPRGSRRPPTAREVTARRCPLTNLRKP